jgi:hypothetical protein
MLRRTLFWAGWVLVVAYVAIFAAQIYITQDLPAITPLKWVILFGTFAFIYAMRDRDEVVQHHLPH